MFNGNLKLTKATWTSRNHGCKIEKRHTNKLGNWTWQEHNTGEVAHRELQGGVADSKR